MRHNFNTLLQTIHQYKLFPNKKRFIIAVSGGADSVALLHWLANNRVQLEVELHVATLNHGLRPEASDDVKYVETLSQSLGINCTSGLVDIPGMLQRSNQGVEATARRARYDFLAQVAQDNNATHIVTAHHADDQAETILMRIIRGTGAQGLTGMDYQAPVPYHPQLTLLRPLLGISRAEIDSYCAEYDLTPRHDATNRDTQYLRNKLRHEILPRLRQINPQIDQSLIRLADVVRTEQDFLHQLYKQNYHPYMTFGERVTIPKRVFTHAHAAMQRYTILTALQHLDVEPSYLHIEHALEIAETNTIGAQAEFEGEKRLRVGYKNLYIEPANLPLPTEDYLLISEQTTVKLDGDTLLADWVLSATREKPPEFDAYLNIKDDAHIIVRTRLQGDRFAPQGMNGHTKSIKKWMIDQKIPRYLRDKIPLLVVNDSIAAIILSDAWSIAEPFTISEKSQWIVYFNCLKV